MVVLILAGLTIIAFRSMLAAEWPNIMAQRLEGWDEATNAVVAANNTRAPFPPMVRLHSLYPQVQGWSDGPYWQHIPPLFTYVPLPFFTWDQRVSAEGYRLSFAYVALLAALLLILAITRALQSTGAALSAASAAILWLGSPFTRHLICGVEFGESDIVLAFSCVVAFGALVSYLARPRNERKHLGTTQIVLLGIVTALPVVVKSALGGLAPFLGFLLLLWDRRRLNRDVALFWISACSIVGAQEVLLYLSSPATFRQELLEPIRHVSMNYEGWGRPWHVFFSDYLPFHYLAFHSDPRQVGVLTLVAPVVFLLALAAFSFQSEWRARRRLQALALTWFGLNLLVVSCIRSKAPNFVFQSWILILYFCCDSLLEWLQRLGRNFAAPPVLRHATAAGLALSALFFPLRGLALLNGIAAKLRRSRLVSAVPRSPSEHFYKFATDLRSRGFDDGTLFILQTGGDDIQLRYPILFLTGGEARTAEELLGATPLEVLRARYRRITVVQKMGSALPATPGITEMLPVGGYEVTTLVTSNLSAEWLHAHAQSLSHLPGLPRLLGLAPVR